MYVCISSFDCFNRVFRKHCINEREPPSSKEPRYSSNSLLATRDIIYVQEETAPDKRNEDIRDGRKERTGKCTPEIPRSRRLSRANPSEPTIWRDPIFGSALCLLALICFEIIRSDLGGGFLELGREAILTPFADLPSDRRETTFPPGVSRK